MEHKDHDNCTIGIVGGGQLAQMLAIEGKKLGIDVIVQTGKETDPAVMNAGNVVLSDIKDISGTKQLASLSNCVTFENEWIDIEGLSLLEDSGVSFIPYLSSMVPLVNKLSQRKLLQKLNVPGPEWLSLSTLKSSNLALPSGWKFPLMAKSSIGGYDGKGTNKINDYRDLSNLLRSVDTKLWFLEKWVDYEQEFSVVISRDKFGKVNIFPLIETFQVNQICDWALAPADVSYQVTAMANNIAISIVRELDFVGVLAIEFFYGVNGLLVNEIAPRTHNSAHLTIEACKTNQFQHQVAIASGLPIESPELVSEGALMVNLLGFNGGDEILQRRLKLLDAIPGLYLHWYKKDNNIPGRKLGHVTKLLDSKNVSERRNNAISIHKHIRSIWPIEE